jgi:hypothetical protein
LAAIMPHALYSGKPQPDAGALHARYFPQNGMADGAGLLAVQLRSPFRCRRTAAAVELTGAPEFDAVRKYARCR